MARTRSLPDDLIHRTIQNIEQAKGIKRITVDRATMRSQCRPPCNMKEPREYHDTISLPSSTVASLGSHVDNHVEVPGTIDYPQGLPMPDTHVDDDDAMYNSSETLRIPDTRPIAHAPPVMGRKDSTVARLTISLNASTALLNSLRTRNEIYAADLERLNHLYHTQPRPSSARATPLCGKRRAACIARLRRESRGKKGWMWAALGSLVVWGAGALWVLGNGVEMEYVRRRRRAMYGLS
ncbi:hypothetical protein B0A48_17749 [Cryoendolithus antarcticus]|uniref:Uncharacterized protein n=1 Tax=Cryoendolithus antarcticus TaxID=1507870 RepID=A0A1V8S9V3_9PEZI|nr:hypothetical protein B0A48_17749 [Cryoendolithus antarcticus]